MIKRKVDLKSSLTGSELVLMKILWDAQRPITGPEILAYLNASPEGPAFARSSYHVFVNNLLDKGYIMSVGGCGHGKNQARRFVPTISRNEYYAGEITSNRRYTASDIPDLVCTLISYSDVSDSQKKEILKSIESLVMEDEEEQQ